MPNVEPAPAKYPDERWVAACPIIDAELLLKYDHHTVWIDGRKAVLLTYPWASINMESQGETLDCVVSFTYANGHPSAPQSIQRIVDRLIFTPLRAAPDAG